MNQHQQNRIFRQFLAYHWLRPEVALLKYYQAVQWRRWKFPAPSLDLLCGDGEFAFITWGGEFDIATDMYVNIQNIAIEDYFSNRDVYNVPFRKKHYHVKKHADIQITTGLDRSIGQVNKAKRLKIYEDFVIYDINAGLNIIPDHTFRSVFTNSLNVADDTKFILTEIRRILTRGGRLFLSVQDRKQVDAAMYHLFKDKNLKLGKILDRGIYQNLFASTYDTDTMTDLVKQCGFKIISIRGYGPEIIFRIYQLGFRPMFPALMEMYNALSTDKRKTVKEKWVDNLYILSEELLDDRNAESFGSDDYWLFLALEK